MNVLNILKATIFSAGLRPGVFTDQDQLKILTNIMFFRNGKQLFYNSLRIKENGG